MAVLHGGIVVIVKVEVFILEFRTSSGGSSSRSGLVVVVVVCLVVVVMVVCLKFLIKISETWQKRTLLTLT